MLNIVRIWENQGIRIHLINSSSIVVVSCSSKDSTEDILQKCGIGCRLNQISCVERILEVSSVESGAYGYVV